jgi:hypothetical protein
MRRAFLCVSVLALTFIAACADSSTAPTPARVIAPSAPRLDGVPDTTCRSGFSVPNGYTC